MGRDVRGRPIHRRGTDCDPPGLIRMNIVVVASEAVPFAKTGGLADVAGSLPRALEHLGHRSSLILPCYRSVWKGAWKVGAPLRATGLTLRIPVGAKTVEGN